MSSIRPIALYFHIRFELGCAKSLLIEFVSKETTILSIRDYISLQEKVQTVLE